MIRRGRHGLRGFVEVSTNQMWMLAEQSEIPIRRRGPRGFVRAGDYQVLIAVIAYFRAKDVQRIEAWKATEESFPAAYTDSDRVVAVKVILAHPERAVAVQLGGHQAILDEWLDL